MSNKLTYDDYLKQLSSAMPPKTFNKREASTSALTSPPDIKNITQRQRSDGSPSYLVNLRLQQDGQPWVYRETFNTLTEAIVARDKARATHRAGGAAPAVSSLGRPHVEIVTKETVADIIALRLRDGKPTGRSARHVLKFISGSYFGSLPAADLTARDIRNLAEHLNNGQRKPQTIATYMTPLIYSLRWAHNREHDVPLSKIQQAMSTLWEDEKITKSAERSRRPTKAELEAILHAVEKNKRQKLPLGKIIMFALFSARRISEICSLRWEDLQENRGRILVRQMKHPRKKSTNDRWCDLTPEALAIIQSMPRTKDRIFPFDAKSACTAWQRHRNKAAVRGLRFHDLRHEAISRLFEMKNTDRFVARISGHEVKGGCLDRYEHVEEAGDRYANWSWLDRVINGYF